MDKTAKMATLCKAQPLEKQKYHKQNIQLKIAYRTIFRDSPNIKAPLNVKFCSQLISYYPQATRQRSLLH